jgi:hypothetical protein
MAASTLLQSLCLLFLHAPLTHAANKITAVYPPSSILPLPENCVASTTNLLGACGTGAGQAPCCSFTSKNYRVSFSTGDGRWWFKPRLIFDGSTTGYTAQWQEDTYLCSGGSCTYRLSDGIAPATYKGEWVAIKLPVLTQLKTVTFYGHNVVDYKVYGAVTGGSWVDLFTKTGATAGTEAGEVDVNTAIVGRDAPAAGNGWRYYDNYAIVVSKTTSSTLVMKELVLTHFVCPAGSYASSNACTDCGAGKITEEAGSRGIGDCSTCAAGSISTAAVSGTCTLCGPGTYRLTAQAADACTDCAAGKYSPDSGRTTDCIECPAGKYKDATGASVCTDCAAGTASLTVGRTTPCVACGTDLKSAAGATECSSLCPAGTQDAGSAVCSPCTAGQANPIAGSSCSACGNGKYAEAGSTACLDCPAGTWKATAATSKCDCTKCVEGKYSSVVGSSAAAGADCTNCPAGTYGSSQGAGSLAYCRPCEPGTWSTAGLSVCSTCSAGQFAPMGSTACFNCPAGKYSKVSGSGICIDCATGEGAPAGSTTCATCPPPPPPTPPPTPAPPVSHA